MEKISQLEGDRNEITSPDEAIKSDHNPPEAPLTDPPTTYAEAMNHGAYALLHELYDQAMRRFEVEELGHDRPEHHLAELALSAAATWWWHHWQPIMMHRALNAGASLGEVAAAAGTAGGPPGLMARYGSPSAGGPASTRTRPRRFANTSGAPLPARC